MKVLLNVKVDELEKEINRQIIVNENIKLQDLCEFIIIAMNGKKIPIYLIEYNNIFYYPLDIDESKNEKSLLDLTLKDLNLKKNNDFDIRYNFDNNYYFRVFVDDFVEKDTNSGNNDFFVLSGKGYGINDNMDEISLISLFSPRTMQYYSHLKKSEKEFLEKTFDYNQVNNKIIEYKKHREELIKPKKYVFNVSLEGFATEIKRKIIVNNDIPIEDFCRKVIVSMNGDLSHLFGIKINKEILSEYYNDLELFYLDLKEKQKFKIIYDFGDNWIFNLTLTKTIDNYMEEDFEVISGKGYGIIDDCGGSWGLSNIFYGDDDSWGDYDINEFDLEKCNEKVKKYSNVRYDIDF